MPVLQDVLRGFVIARAEKFINIFITGDVEVRGDNIVMVRKRSSGPSLAPAMIV